MKDTLLLIALVILIVSAPLWPGKVEWIKSKVAPVAARLNLKRRTLMGNLWRGIRRYPGEGALFILLILAGTAFLVVGPLKGWHWYSYTGLAFLSFAAAYIHYKWGLGPAIHVILSAFRGQPTTSEEEEIPNELPKKPLRPENLTKWRDIAKWDLIDRKTALESEVGGLLAQLKKDAHDEPSLYPRPWIYAMVIGLYLGVQIALAWVIWSHFSHVSIGGIPVDLRYTVLVLQMLHFALSWRSVEVDALAGIDFFGRPALLPEPGPILVPRGLLRLSREARPYQDIRFPGDPNKIWRVSSKKQDETPGGDMPPLEQQKEHVVRPIIALTGEPRGVVEVQRGEERNPLERQLAVEFAYFARYRLSTLHGGIFRIHRNVGRTDIHGRIKDLLREQGDTELRSILSSQTAATVIENWDLIKEVLTLKFTVVVMRWGVDMHQGSLVDMNPSHETNEAQARVARADFDRMSTIIAADAESQATIKKGGGLAEAERLRLFAQAAGIKKIMGDTGVSGETVFAAETAKDALKNADTVVVGASSGMADLIGLVEAGKKLFKPKPPATGEGDQPQGGTP
ncbi:hypothetical protein A2671_01855 [Candidatus Kaiserbacteria bacterium RIFCSPHIGHO2_01_FULL_49_13]|uniref:Band 7 domain-containing protein n=1 Tax=Candidatus Kaiserbacteria bacterium RIFCSPHIGHO2_01_FULL_49_13 TaxID=1798477 RepID=A0A1F6CDJ7_9BACT|nr:MAG: hypothetical protein A2671_01855 [Candidatus Kaiserbacteria bacterium RIFCSPHIGHO2_01_FULL_49_13]